MEFLLNVGDWPLVAKTWGERRVPVFSWCGSTDTFDVVLPQWDVTRSTILGNSESNPDLLASQVNNEEGNKAPCSREQFESGLRAFVVVAGREGQSRSSSIKRVSTISTFRNVDAFDLLAFPSPSLSRIPVAKACGENSGAVFSWCGSTRYLHWRNTTGLLWRFLTGAGLGAYSMGIQRSSSRVSGARQQRRSSETRTVVCKQP